MEKTFRIVLIILAIGIMAFSGYKLWDIYWEYAAGDKLYDDYADRFVIDIIETGEREIIETAHEVMEDINLSVDFDALVKDNEDIVGWIYSENTPINYPIVQSHDNDYYLRRLLDGSYNIAGSIFMDYRNSCDFSDLNTIIYGHNLKNETMFGTLKEYRNQDYYDKHPKIYIASPDNRYVIDLVAGYETDISDEIYEIPETNSELEVLYEKIIKLSNFKTNISFDEGDRLLTLSTCSGGPKISRYVLIGKLSNNLY